MWSAYDAATRHVDSGGIRIAIAFLKAAAVQAGLNAASDSGIGGTDRLYPSLLQLANEEGVAVRPAGSVYDDDSSNHCAHDEDDGDEQGEDVEGFESAGFAVRRADAPDQQRKDGEREDESDRNE